MASRLLPSSASPFSSLRARKALAQVVLGLLIVLAGISASRRDRSASGDFDEISFNEQFVERLFDDLNHLQSVHVLAHGLGFAFVAVLLGPWGLEDDRGSVSLALSYTASASVLWETVQAVVWSATVARATHVNLLTQLLRECSWDFLGGILFDFLVNGLAALLGLALVVWAVRRRALE